MNFNKAEKLLKKIKNYRNINDENYKNLKDYAKWLFIELQRQDFIERTKGGKMLAGIKEPIADKYCNQFQELLDVIGKKLFSEKTQLCKKFCFLNEELSKGSKREEHIINLIIDNIEIIKNHKNIFVLPRLSYVIFYKDKEYKTISLYEIDRYSYKLFELYNLIKRISYHKENVYNLWSKECVYAVSKGKLLNDRKLTSVEEYEIKKETAVYENSIMKFVDIPNYILELKKEVNKFLEDKFFDNMNWNYLRVLN